MANLGSSKPMLTTLVGKEQLYQEFSNMFGVPKRWQTQPLFSIVFRCQSSESKRTLFSQFFVFVVPFWVNIKKRTRMEFHTTGVLFVQEPLAQQRLGIGGTLVT